VLAGCADAPRSSPAPLEDRTPGAAPPASASAPPGSAGPLLRPRSRWVAVDWADLPGWQNDRLRDWWPALQRGCVKPAPGWAAACADALGRGALNDEAARAWVQQWLRPYRVESLEGVADGLITGYLEASVEATRTPQATMRVPVHAAPADLDTRKPYWTRQQLDSLPAAMASLRGRELAWLADPLDALFLHIQGSGRVTLREPDGSRRLVRLAYAANNGQPYGSVGKWLIEQGELTPQQASWPDIKAWARAHPKRVNELLWSNPRVVFFREEPLPDPAVGPKGAQGVPLTPGRSIAVDPLSLPYGSAVWLDTTEPLSATPLRRLVMAQDTGSAITGAVRADYFWGWGDEAEAQAGRMKQLLRMWVLQPR